MSKIVIVDYNPNWPSQFKEIANEIRALLGSNVLRIDHIGSTAVAGLAAKDIIDIQLTVSNLTDATDIDKLQDAGYLLMPHVTHDLLTGLDDASPELQKRFLNQRNGQRDVNVHIREDGRLNQVYPLVFRDYLRANALTREAYAKVKKELATRFSGDREAYYAIKDPYMDTIYEAAKLWAKINNWQPDSDFF